MGASRELDLLERIASVLRGEARQAAKQSELQPVQLDVLMYLDRCNRYSDTPMAVAEHLGLTKGTVSQSILRLEEKGFVEREADASDGRVVHLALTKEGRRVARSSWRLSLERAIEASDLESGSGLADRLEALLREMQRHNGNRSFGVCETCRFLERRGASAHRCGLTQEPLSRADTQRICREHEFV